MINKISIDEIETESFNKKWCKTKQISIKKIKIKFDMKIRWNQMLRDVIEKKSIKKIIKNKTNKNQKNVVQISQIKKSKDNEIEKKSNFMNYLK